MMQRQNFENPFGYSYGGKKYLVPLALIYDGFQTKMSTSLSLSCMYQK